MSDLRVASEVSLNINADQEYVEVILDLFHEVIKQIDSSCISYGLDEVATGVFVENSLVNLFKEIADAEGYHRLYYDLNNL